MSVLLTLVVSVLTDLRLSIQERLSDHGHQPSDYPPLTSNSDFYRLLYQPRKLTPRGEFGEFGVVG